MNYAVFTCDTGERIAVRIDTISWIVEKKPSYTDGQRCVLRADSHSEYGDFIVSGTLEEVLQKIQEAPDEGT